MRLWDRLLPLPLVLILFAGSSCSKPEDEEPLEQPKPPAVDVTQAQPYQLPDAELNEAMKSARETLSAFIAESMDNNSTGTAFIVKVHAITAKGAEDLWLSSIAQDNGHYTAIVESDPTVLTDFQPGTEVRFSIGEVVEWHYFKDDKVVGAQVTRILRKRMTPEQRAEHDVIYPFPFE
jgi:uncharacterized protein YegJ (DUF2314 family)